MERIKKLISLNGGTDIFNAALEDILNAATPDDFDSFVRKYISLSDKDLNKFHINVLFTGFDRFFGFIQNNLGEKDAFFFKEKGDRLLEAYDVISRLENAVNIFEHLNSIKDNKEAFDLYVEKQWHFLEKVFFNITENLKERLKNSLDKTHIDLMLARIEESYKRLKENADHLNKNYLSRLNDFYQNVPPVNVVKLQNLYPIDVVKYLLSLKKLIQLKDHEPNFSDLFISMDYEPRALYDRYNEDFFRNPENLKQFLQPFNCIMNDIREFERLFRPVNPILFCTAISVAIVTGKDYKNTLQSFITGVPNSCLDTAFFSLEEIDDAIRPEVFRFEQLFMYQIELIGETYIQAYGEFKESRLTQYHKRWAEWMVVNPVCQLGKRYIAEWWAAAYIDSKRTNSIIHKLREKYETQLKDNNARLNIAINSREKNEVAALTNERKKITGLLTRSNILYVYNVSEIHADWLGQFGAQKLI